MWGDEPVVSIVGISEETYKSATGTTPCTDNTVATVCFKRKIITWVDCVPAFVVSSLVALGIDGPLAETVLKTILENDRVDSGNSMTYMIIVGSAFPGDGGRGGGDVAGSNFSGLNGASERCDVENDVLLA